MNRLRDPKCLGLDRFGKTGYSTCGAPASLVCLYGPATVFRHYRCSRHAPRDGEFFAVRQLTSQLSLFGAVA